MGNIINETSTIRLKEIRTMLKWSKSKLATEAGLSRQAITIIENGQKSPTLNTLNKIAAALGVSVSQIIGESEIEIKEAI